MLEEGGAPLHHISLYQVLGYINIKVHIEGGTLYSVGGDIAVLGKISTVPACTLAAPLQPLEVLQVGLEGLFQLFDGLGHSALFFPLLLL